jgi:hypothetical protein
MDRVQVEPNWRAPVGIALILLLIALWSFLVVSGAALIAPLPWPVHAIYYVAAGLVWILPLKPLIRWMGSGGKD